MSRDGSRDTPAVLRNWIVRYGEVEPDGAATGALRAAGLRALERAMTPPSGTREAAHALLAADALITAACEAAASADEPEAALLESLRALRAEAG